VIVLPVAAVVAGAAIVSATAVMPRFSSSFRRPLNPISFARPGLLKENGCRPRNQRNMNPIALHPDNGHYFRFRGKPAVLVTSAEHYGAVLTATSTSSLISTSCGRAAST
jgi:hypothetical protein